MLIHSTARRHPGDFAALREAVRAVVAAMPIVILVKALRGR